MVITFFLNIIVITISKAINMRKLSIKNIHFAISFEDREGPGYMLGIMWLTVR